MGRAGRGEEEEEEEEEAGRGGGREGGLVGARGEKTNQRVT